MNAPLPVFSWKREAVIGHFLTTLKLGYKRSPYPSMHDVINECPFTRIFIEERSVEPLFCHGHDDLLGPLLKLQQSVVSLGFDNFRDVLKVTNTEIVI